MEKKYVMLSIEDSKIGTLSKVLGNKTCKKILDFLAETKEASEQDIAAAIKSPINTVEYNLKPLIESGLIEKSKVFFWSKKGKKIPMYKVSNKSIVISPKSSSKVKSILPVALISLAGALVVRQIFLITKTSTDFAREEVNVLMNQGVVSTASGATQKIAEAAPSIPTGISDSIRLIPTSNIWLWFLFGAAFAFFIFLIFNWRKL
jgi:DNA-binding transcriptional ArsR family regulator